MLGAAGWNAKTLGAYFRNANASGPSWLTINGAHSGGRLDNFLMADGHIESLTFPDTGTWMAAGGDWRDTLWDGLAGR